MNQTAKIGIVVVLLIIAGIVTVKFMGGDEKPLELDDTKTLWMCSGCKESSEFTSKEVAVLAKEAGPPAPPFICHKCKEKKVYRALKCQKCGTVYFGTDVPESTGVCPQCSPDVKAPPPESDVVPDAAPEDDNTPAETETGPKKIKKKVKAA